VGVCSKTLKKRGEKFKLVLTEAKGRFKTHWLGGKRGGGKLLFPKDEGAINTKQKGGYSCLPWNRRKKKFTKKRQCSPRGRMSLNEIQSEPKDFRQERGEGCKQRQVLSEENSKRGALDMVGILKVREKRLSETLLGRECCQNRKRDGKRGPFLGVGKGKWKRGVGDLSLEEGTQAAARADRESR